MVQDNYKQPNKLLTNVKTKYLYIKRSNITQYCTRHANSKWSHDDAIKRKHFPRYWPFVRGIHRSPVNSLHKGRWHGALMFSLICVWINDWVNNREAGDLRRYRGQYDVTVMTFAKTLIWRVTPSPQATSSRKRKGRQDNCPDRHCGRWRQASGNDEDKLQRPQWPWQHVPFCVRLPLLSTQNIKISVTLSAYWGWCFLWSASE